MLIFAYCKASALLRSSRKPFNWVSLRLRIVIINDPKLCAQLSQTGKAEFLSTKITCSLTLENLSSGFAMR